MKNWIRSWKKKVLPSCLSIAMVVTLLFQPAIASAASQVESVANEHVVVYVSKNTGRFVIETVKGHPQRHDDDAALLFGGKQPKTSFATFRIDGEDYIFGNNYGFLGMDSGFIQQPLTSGMLNQTVWHLKGVEITQTFTIVNDPENPNLGNVKITYEAKNTTNSPVSIGSRILLDTMLGDEDGALLTVEGRNTFIQQETEFIGDDVPEYWRAVDHENAPLIAAYGLLGDWGNQIPDRLVFAHWQGIGSSKWDYDVDPNIRFSSKKNIYQSADSAVGIYWNAETLAPKASRTYETYYGIGDFQNESDPATFDLVLTGPNALTVNAKKDGYVEDTFDIHLLIDNSLVGAKPMNNARVQLGLPPNLQLTGNQKAVRNVSLGVNQTTTLTWTVKAIPQTIYQSSRYFVSVTSGSENLTKADYILLPSVSGAPPAVQVHQMVPPIKYTGDAEQKLVLTGTGLSLLNSIPDLKMTLERHDKKMALDIPVNKVGFSADSMTINLDGVWPDKPAAGQYYIKIDAGSFGSFSKGIVYVNDPGYQIRSYGLLAITKAVDQYDVVPVAKESDLKKLNDEVLLVFRGNIDQIGENMFDVKDGATINSVISYTHSDKVRDWLGRQQKMTIERTDTGISLLGIGELSIPDFTFTSGEFAINLKNGVEYSLNPDYWCRNNGTFDSPVYSCDKKMLEDDEPAAGNERPIQIEWPEYTWFENTQILAKLPVALKSVTIGKESVSFGGHITLSLKGDKKKEKNSPAPDPDEEEEEKDKFGLTVDLEEARFGKLKNNQFGLLGVRGYGEVGIPKGFIPGMKFGAGAKAEIDTFRKIYAIEVAASFEVVQVNGEITLRFTETDVPVVDKFIFTVGNKPGIPITPFAPIGFITQAGGGFDRLYDTIMGNYNILPPLTIKLRGAMTFAQVLEAENLEFSMSMQEIFFTADLSVLGFEILNDVYAKILAHDTTDYLAVEAQMGANLTISDIIDGYVEIVFSYDNRRRGLFGPVYMSGTGGVVIKIPAAVPVAGGQKFADIMVQLSTEHIMGQVNALGLEFGVAYTWADGKFKFLDADHERLVRIASANAMSQNKVEGIGQEVIIDPNTGREAGTFVFGTNVTRGGMITRPSNRPVQILSNQYVYTAEVTDDVPNVVFEFAFSGEEAPVVEVTKPNNEKYTLTEEIRDEEGNLVQAGNYYIQVIPAEYSETGQIEKRMFISAPAEAGEWSFSSNQALHGSILKVAALPKINHVDVTHVGDNLTVTWDASAADDMNVAFYLTETNEVKTTKDGSIDPGILLAGPDDGIKASAGEVTLSIPPTVASGDYYVKAVLVQDGSNAASRHSEDSFTYVNAAAPDAPESIVIEPLGNGFVAVDWVMDGEADGFALHLLNAAGEPIPGLGVVMIDDAEQRSANIGGVYMDNETGEEMGLIPGQTYKVAVRAFRDVDGLKVYSPAAISATLTVEEPNPADVELSLEATWDADKEQYVTNQTAVELKFTSDQSLIQSEVYLNNLYQFSHDGASWTDMIELPEDGTHLIEVITTNDAGDMTVTGMQVHRDATAPDLKIESPERAHFSGNTVAVRGVAEPGSSVTVNGEPVALDADGVFATELSMAGHKTRTVTIAAVDHVGNKTEYEAQVVNTEHITDRIKARVKGVEAEPDGSYILQPGHLWQLEVYSVDTNGKEYAMDDVEVEWSMLYGGLFGELAVNNQLDLQTYVPQDSYREGKLAILASYALSDDYALTDAVVIQVDLDGHLPPKPYNPDGSTGGSSGSDHQGSDRSGSTSGDPLDQVMEQLLRSLIAAEGTVEFIGGVKLSSGGETIVELDQSAVLTLFGTGAAFGYGKVIDPDALVSDEIVRLSEIYEFSLSEPITFDAPPVLVIQLPQGIEIDAKKAAIYWYNELKNRWEYIGGNYDAETGTITAGLPHFSKYALLLDHHRTLFTDVDGRWSEDAIYRLQSVGIIDGYRVNNTWQYQPAKSITRQEFIKLLVSVADVDLTRSQISDIYQDRDKVGEWAKPYVQTAIQKKWLTGVEHGGSLHLQPQKEITRAEAATLIARMLDFPLLQTAALSFTDRQQVPSWAAPAVAALEKEKLIKGYPDGSFRPGNLITREEAAALLLQVLTHQYRTTE